MKTKKSPRKIGLPDPNVLANIVQRIVEAAQPEKIILFGSAARGEMGPDSDIDLLVIKRGRFNRDRVTRDIYRRLSGSAAGDALVVTTEEVEKYGGSPFLVICPALREGRVVYPGFSGPVTKRQYRRALRIAEAVVRWAERQIGKP